MLYLLAISSHIVIYIYNYIYVICICIYSFAQSVFEYRIVLFIFTKIKQNTCQLNDQTIKGRYTLPVFTARVPAPVNTGRVEKTLLCNPCSWAVITGREQLQGPWTRVVCIGEIQTERSKQQDLEESENVKLVGDVLTHLIETDSHETDVRTTQLVGLLLYTKVNK